MTPRLNSQHQYPTQSFRILCPITLPDLRNDLDRPEDGSDGAKDILEDWVFVWHGVELVDRIEAV